MHEAELFIEPLRALVMLPDGQQQFVRASRAGGFDRGGARENALAVMAAITCQKLVESNPDILAAGKDG